jgi:hypothetical protein
MVEGLEDKFRAGTPARAEGAPENIIKITRITRTVSMGPLFVVDIRVLED